MWLSTFTPSQRATTAPSSASCVIFTTLWIIGIMIIYLEPLYVFLISKYRCNFSSPFLHLLIHADMQQNVCLCFRALLDLFSTYVHIYAHSDTRSTCVSSTLYILHFGPKLQCGSSPLSPSPVCMYSCMHVIIYACECHELVYACACMVFCIFRYAC